MAYVRIRPRRSTAAEWEYNNPILAEGEIGFEVPYSGVGTGLIKMKQGDGVTAWNDLPYAINNEAIEEIVKSSVIIDTTDRVSTTELPNA